MLAHTTRRVCTALFEPFVCAFEDFSCVDALLLSCDSTFSTTDMVPQFTSHHHNVRSLGLWRCFLRCEIARGECERMSISVAALLIHHMHAHPIETISTTHHPSTHAPTFTHTFSQTIVKWRVDLLYRWCGTRFIRLTDVPPALRTITACVAVLHPPFIGWRPILEDP